MPQRLLWDGGQVHFPEVMPESGLPWTEDALVPEGLSPELKGELPARWEGGRVKLAKPEPFIFASKNSHSPPKPTLKTRVYLSLSALFALCC